MCVGLKHKVGGFIGIKGPWLIEGVKHQADIFIFIFIIVFFSHDTRWISQENLKEVSILKYEMHT